MKKSELKSNIARYGKRFMIVLLVGIIVLFIIIYALRAQTHVTGAYPASIKTGSVICTKANASYPYVDSPDTESPNHGSMRIVGTYNDTNIIEKVALDYSVFFEDNSAATIGEAVLHGEFGKRLSAEDLPYSELNNNFSIVDKKVTLSLYATSDNITAQNYKYLLLDSRPKGDLFLGQFEKNYTSQGYKCVSTNQD